MIPMTVTYGDVFLDRAIAEYPLERSPDYDGPTFAEFMGGPVLAARLQFERKWDSLVCAAGPSLRISFLPPTQAFGPIVFYGCLVKPNAVEIADFEDHKDYWTMIEGNPDD